MSPAAVVPTTVLLAFLFIYTINGFLSVASRLVFFITVTQGRVTLYMLPVLMLLIGVCDAFLFIVKHFSVYASPHFFWSGCRR